MNQSTKAKLIVFSLAFLAFQCWQNKAFSQSGSKLEKRTEQGLSKTRKAAFGFEVRPIIPSAIFRIKTDVVKVDDVVFTISPRPGYTYGAFLSFNLSQRFSLETGINYINRDFRISVEDKNINTSLQFTADNYEMPLISSYYVRLGKNLYMGHSAGVSFQFLPSHLASIIKEKDSTGTVIRSLEQISRRKYWLMPAYRGGIGWEYRTEENGYIYLGTTYMLFTALYKTRLFYNRGQVDIKYLDVKPIGDFFGITVRYVFPPTDMFKREKSRR